MRLEKLILAFFLENRLFKIGLLEHLSVFNGLAGCTRECKYCCISAELTRQMGLDQLQRGQISYADPVDLIVGL